MRNLIAFLLALLVIYFSAVLEKLSKPPKVFRVNPPLRRRFTPGFRRCSFTFL